MQDNLINIFSKIYNISFTEKNEYSPIDSNNIFILETKLIEDKKTNRYKLNTGRILSTSSEKIQNALSKKEILSEDKILESIITRYNKNN